MKNILMLANAFYKYATSAIDYNDYNKKASQQSVKIINDALQKSNRFSIESAITAFSRVGEDTGEIAADDSHIIYGEKLFVKIYDRGDQSKGDVKAILKNILSPISSYVEIRKQAGRHFEVVLQLKGYTKNQEIVTTPKFVYKPTVEEDVYDDFDTKPTPAGGALAAGIAKNQPSVKSTNGRAKDQYE